jgi:hypothetical protein
VRPIWTAMAAMEIAYVDRPHLAKTLRVWRITFTPRMRQP